MKWVRPLSGFALVVPFYHMVNDAHVPHVSHLYRFRSVAEFTADVEFFARHFQPVTLGDIVDALDGKRLLPKACVHLTFDDGFREMYDVVAPILQRAGIPATFFLNTAFLDEGGLAHYNALSVLLDEVQRRRLSSTTMTRFESLLPAPRRGCTGLRDRVLAIGYSEVARVSSLAEVLNVDLKEFVTSRRPHLSSEQIAGLVARGFTIGAHSHNHPLYANLSYSDQLWQTETSMEILERRFGVSPRAFAFPHNDTGVGEEFFSTMFSNSFLDVSFGTSGLVAHFHPRNIQRISMENTPAPSSHILSHQFTRATFLRLRNRARAGRPI
jgi:peptidoglycan/xylan/chitin deacetylase (PgdA/CDA1 family)